VLGRCISLHRYLSIHIQFKGACRDAYILPTKDPFHCIACRPSTILFLSMPGWNPCIYILFVLFIFLRIFLHFLLLLFLKTFFCVDCSRKTVKASMLKFGMLVEHYFFFCIHSLLTMLALWFWPQGPKCPCTKYPLAPKLRMLYN